MQPPNEPAPTNPANPAWARDLPRLLAALRDVLVVADRDMRVSYVSPSVFDVLGYAPGALVGRSILDLLHPDEHPIARRHIAERFAARNGRTLVHRSVHADGRVRYLESMIDVLHDDAGTFRGAVFNARDVTDRVHQQQRLEREVAVRGALVELTNELLSTQVDAAFYQHALERAIALVPDAQGGSVMLEREDGRLGFVAAVGFDLGALQVVSIDVEAMRRGDVPRAERRQLRPRPPGFSEFALDVLRHAGRRDEIRVALAVPLLVAGKVHGYLNLDHFERADAFGVDDLETAEAIGAQVSVALQRRLLERDLQRERARFERLATHDALTDLPNRRLFHERLDQAIARVRRHGGRFALLYVDLDGFKQVNDRHGHEVGDRVLQATGDRLRATVRVEDTVARLGGDEFGAMVEGVATVEEACAVAQKLRGAIAATLPGDDWRLDASIGVAIFPDHGADTDAIMRAADGAMYHVKARGAGGVACADEATARRAVRR